MVNPVVVIGNLGSPDSTEVADVRQYLKEFLLDPRVIDYPAPLRNLIVRGLILPFRPKKSAEAYREIWTEQGSPLLVTTEKLRAKLEEELDMPVLSTMRYRNPSIASTVRDIAEKGYDRVFFMPQYPQYAMSSYETVVVAFLEEMRKVLPDVEVTTLQPFYQDPDYLDALAAVSKPYLEDPFDLLLCSFHGVPRRHLLKGDPSHAHCQICPNCCEQDSPVHAVCYRHQCVKTIESLLPKLGVPPEKSKITFQSRLGREVWLEPYTDETLKALPGQGIKHLRVMCPAFTVDCLETLEEINGEGRDIFMEAGGESFEMIPCLNDQAPMVRFLANRVKTWLPSLEA